MTEEIKRSVNCFACGTDINIRDHDKSVKVEAEVKGFHWIAYAHEDCAEKIRLRFYDGR